MTSIDVSLIDGSVRETTFPNQINVNGTYVKCKNSIFEIKLNSKYKVTEFPQKEFADLVNTKCDS